MFRLFRKPDPTAQAATELYGSVVTQARHVSFYSDLMVPDTKEGRFEVLVLHLVMLIERIRAEAGSADPLARALTETFVTDMDDNFREVGIGDTSVPKKVKKAAGALYDRTFEYRALSEAGDAAGFARAIGGHVFDDEDRAQARKIADYAIAGMQDLDAVPLDDIRSGRISFRAPLS